MRRRGVATSPHSACRRRRSACRCPLCLRVAVPLALGALASLPSASARAHETQRAQPTHGIVRDARVGDPLAGARVLVIGTNFAATTSGDGVFRFDVALPDSFSVRAERLGYRSKTVRGRADAGGRIEIALDPSPLALQPLVVTGAVTARPATETARPVTVLSGEELQIRLRGTVAGALAREPGFATGTMGPAAARPVVRGMGGDRVLILEDGIRTGDVSGSAPDHATAVDASSSSRVEVVRGPAALLYGSNALGGVINVVRDEIPTSATSVGSGTASLRGATVDGAWGAGAAATVALADRAPLRVEASGRRSGDLRTPAGTLGNTGADTWTLGTGASYDADWGQVGAAFRSYSNDYGVPGGLATGHDAGVRIEMERASTKFRAVLDQPRGPYESVELNGAHTWYRHSEIEPPDILGTFFKVESTSAELVAKPVAAGPFSRGALGVRASREAFSFAGGIGMPNTRRTTWAAYVFQEVEMGAFRVEGGLRYDWIAVDPLRDDPGAEIGAIGDRSFQAASGSVALLYATGPGLIVGVNAGRAFRTPDVSELYSDGPHLATYSFEVGNPALGAERGTGVDLFLRYAGDRVRAELSGFRNVISGYVFAHPTGELSRVLLPVYQHQANDAAFTGFEAAADWNVAAGWALQGTASHVRAEFTDTGRPVPMIPPLRGRVSVEHERPSWFARVEAELAGGQERVGEFETPTAGYEMFDVVAGLRFNVRGRLSVLTVSLENVTNEEYRNHLSRAKEILPEAGRGLAVSWRVAF